MRLVARQITGRAEKPENEVDVVTRFCEQRAYALRSRTSPVTTDIRVGEMPPADWLRVLDGDYLANDLV